MSEPPGLARLLELEAHPEGGWFRQTWRTDAALTPPGYPGERATATGILFLLAPGESSAWHRVRSDEVWLWHRGPALSLWVGADDGEREIVLGPRVEDGQTPQAIVPGGCWQRAEPHASTEPVLVSCVVSPGFDFEDFTLQGAARM